MAQKRMFDRDIIRQWSFISSSSETKALYFLLNMDADDKGFVDPRPIMSLHRISNEALASLVRNGYVLVFESGVVVITDWKKNNYLDKNRINDTVYKDEEKLIIFDEADQKYKFILNSIPAENKILALSAIEENHTIDDNHSSGLTSVKQTFNQNRIEEKRIEENRIEDIKEKNHLAEEDVHEANTESQFSKSSKPNNTINLETEFEKIWNIYPNKKGKDQAKTKYIKARKSGTTYERILQGLNNYINYIKQNNIDEQYIKHGSTWFNKKCWEDEYKTSKKSEPSWFNQKIEKVEVSAQERKELEEMINKFNQK